MPGYVISDSEKQRLGSKYTCNSCGLLLRGAVQTSCGHFYCSSCLASLFQNGSTRMICLQDQKEFLPNEVFPDNFMRRKVQAFVVNCTHEDEGCNWRGEVRHLEGHLNNCEFLKLPCIHPKCGAQVKKSELIQHLEKECECRLETCGFCKKLIKLNKMKHHHETDCPAYPVICQKCNKDGILRAKLLQHQDPMMGDFDSVRGLCPYSQVGWFATEALTQKQRKEHLEKHNTLHTTLLLHYAIRMSKEIEALLVRDPRIVSRNLHLVSNYDSVITDLFTQVQTQAGETGNLREKCQEHSERITALERKVASENLSGPATTSQIPGESSGGARDPEITRRVTNVENRTAEHEVLLVENNRTLKEVRRDMGNMKRQLDTTQESSRRHDRRIESIEHTLALRNVTLADLEEYVRQQEFSSYDGQLLRKISDYARKRNDAVTGKQVSFYSPCFYTSRYGYKMCARIYLNGDGMGRGTHISIFSVVMRGQYDALLCWPFRQKVTFMLLDQDNVEHVIDAFRPDPNSSSFQRPRRETNIEFGVNADFSEHVVGDGVRKSEKRRFRREESSANVVKNYSLTRGTVDCHEEGISVCRADHPGYFEEERARRFETRRSCNERGGANVMEKGQINANLPRQVNFLLSGNMAGQNNNSTENSLELKEEMNPSLNDTTTRNTASPRISAPNVSDQNGQRLIDLENQVAHLTHCFSNRNQVTNDIAIVIQHLVSENDQLKSAVCDINNRVNHIQVYLNSHHANFNTLRNEQSDQREELVRIQEGIRRLEEHANAQETMLRMVSDSITGLATLTRSRDIENL